MSEAQRSSPSAPGGDSRKLTSRESTIEKAVCDYAKKQGCITMKLSGANQRGQPDRMFIKNGRVLFIEFKAPGKLPTALQTRWLADLSTEGMQTAVCDDILSGIEFVASLVATCSDNADGTLLKSTVLLAVLSEMKEYIEEKEEMIDGEWGACRDFDEIHKSGKVTKAYDLICEILSANAERTHGANQA